MRLLNDRVTAESLIFVSVMGITWWTISAGTSFPRSKQRSHMPGGHILPSSVLTVDFM